MLYTSYFANIRNLPDNVLPIAICGKTPQWFEGLHYKRFAPKYKSFIEWKQTQDNARYTRCFEEQVLNHLDIEDVLNDLINISTHYAHIALVCYEKPDAFCHRHLVAEWFRRNGYACEEWGLTIPDTELQRMQLEFKKWVKSLNTKGKSPDTILEDFAYEYTSKQELIYFVEGLNASTAFIEFLNGRENILEYLWSEYLDSDSTNVQNEINELFDEILFKFERGHYM